MFIKCDTAHVQMQIHLQLKIENIYVHRNLYISSVTKLYLFISILIHNSISYLLYNQTGLTTVQCAYMEGNTTQQLQLCSHLNEFFKSIFAAPAKLNTKSKTSQSPKYIERGKIKILTLSPST